MILIKVIFERWWLGPFLFSFSYHDRRKIFHCWHWWEKKVVLINI